MVTDGERALQRRVTATFKGVTLVLDLLHVMEKLWKVGHALYGEGSPEAVAFVRERARRVLDGEVSQVVKGLRLIATKRRLTGEKAKTLKSVADYLYANRTRMAYDDCMAKGWPIKRLGGGRLQVPGSRSLRAIWDALVTGDGRGDAPPASDLPLRGLGRVLGVAHHPGPGTALPDATVASRRKVATPSSFLTSASFARIRFAMVLRRSQKRPYFDFRQ